MKAGDDPAFCCLWRRRRLHEMSMPVETFLGRIDGMVTGRPDGIIA
jgi:hypothetical protein